MDEKMTRAVIATLNQIEVKGKQNMDKLLGCINVLEASLEKKEEEVKRNG